VIHKSDLMAAAWPHATVAEDNLRSQVFGLRRALGEDGGAIKNVAGRGYLLAADLTADERPGAVGSPPAHTPCDLVNGSSSGLQEGLEQ
jgi:DNA-binding winged helix-turn-helix (wHTH) protein